MAFESPALQTRHRPDAIECGSRARLASSCPPVAAAKESPMPVVSPLRLPLLLFTFSGLVGGCGGALGDQDVEEAGGEGSEIRWRRRHTPTADAGAPTVAMDAGAPPVTSTAARQFATGFE